MAQSWEGSNREKRILFNSKFYSPLFLSNDSGKHGARLCELSSFLQGKLKTCLLLRMYEMGAMGYSPTLYVSFCCFDKWVFPKIGVSQNGWLIMESPIKMDDLGGTIIIGNIQIYLDPPTDCQIGWYKLIH